jgi:hypothetical protein
MTDPTAPVRRAMIASGQPAADLAADEGQRWTTDELRAEFEVIGFAAPFVIVRRRSDGLLGTLEFTASPRTYFGWEPGHGDLHPAVEVPQGPHQPPRCPRRHRPAVAAAVSRGWRFLGTVRSWPGQRSPAH